MKKAEDYLNYWTHLYDMTLNYDKRGRDAILSMINEARKDAIDETVKRCAEEAAIFENKQPVPENVTRLRKFTFEDFTYILRVADKLKKELE